MKYCKNHIFLLLTATLILLGFLPLLRAQEISESEYLFDYSIAYKRNIVKISKRLINLWKVNGDILRLYYYCENDPWLQKHELDIGQTITDLYFLEDGLKFPGTEKITLIDNGYNFDSEAGDGIHGAYRIGQLNDYTTHDQTVKIRFDPTTLTIHALKNSVILIPKPPVIVRPAHKTIIDSLKPMITWYNDEIADGSMVILLENKPVQGNLGTILTKSEFLYNIAAESKWKIPVSLSNGTKYHLIIWSYFQNKFVEGRWMGSVYSMQWSTFTVDTTIGKEPVKFVHNFPNPFNESTFISWDQLNPEEVNIKVYDILGKEVVTLYEGIKPSGWHSLQWDARNEKGVRVTSGIYILQSRVGKQQNARKMILIN